MNHTDSPSLLCHSRHGNPLPVAAILMFARLASYFVTFVVAASTLLTAQNVVLTGAIGVQVTNAREAIMPRATITLQDLVTRIQPRRAITPSFTVSGRSRGINQVEYNPIGTQHGEYPCADGVSLNQTYFVVPNSAPGNFATLQEISPHGPAARFVVPAALYVLD